ncbi:hypothetical protein B0D71_29235 [Pseudomonas laurylsulfativorans]|uniref:Uncharacterized protein n=1 Tax=Pseudomonas laurylsulfativorans TaxID=1943631 RepID=A0A2S3VFW9_9PSED|nr:hypothetical protein B0D71_29235 [Pseudomonas laurylsulfativorans]
MYVLCLREDRDRPNDIEPCGSELARDGGGSVNIHAECDAAIASRLAPTGVFVACCYSASLADRDYPAPISPPAVGGFVELVWIE